MKRSLFILLFLLWSIAPAQAAVKVQEVISPGGIKAWLVQDNKLPLISMQFAFRGGVEQDPADKQGLAELTMALLTQGAGPYDDKAFQQQLADQSIQLGFNAGRDTLSGSLKTLSATRTKAFHLLHLALTQPRFEIEAFERARNQQMTAMKFELGDPDWQARYALLSTLFKDHPYAMRHYGTIATLKSLTRDDVKTFADQHLARDNLVIGVAGDITSEELAKALDEIFGLLPEKAQLKSVPDFVWPEKPEQILVNRVGTQTEIMFAAPAPRRDDPDWYAMEIVNYTLGGGGFSSRLMREVRDKEGLTYGIATQLAPMDHVALIMGQAATDNAKAGAAQKLLTRVWRGVFKTQISDDEIEAAKDYLTGSLPLQLTSTSAIAGILVGMQLENLGMDYLDRYTTLIQQVKPEDIKRVIQRWLDPAVLYFAFTGKPEDIHPTLVREEVRE